MTTTIARWRPAGGHMAAALSLLILVAASACAAGTGEDVRASATTSASTSPAEEQDWGPLAVMELASGFEARTGGEIVITEHCVFLDRPGDDDPLMLLVWPAERTTWEADDRSVRFTERSGEILVFRNGDNAIFGGGGYSRQESGESFGPIDPTNWTAAPAPECVVDAVWFISTEAIWGLQ